MFRWIFLMALACACSTGSTGPRRDGGGDGGLDASGEACRRDRDCDDGETCSTIGLCIPDGQCRADADCEGGQYCGLGSRVCLDDGTCGVPADCPEGQTCNGEGTCEIGGGCGASEFATTRLEPNVLIVLDRSGSMGRDAGGPARWDAAKDAIQTVTTRFDADIRFGLATYSACLPGGCSAGSIVVPIAEAAASSINGFLAPLTATGSSAGTPPDYLCDSGDPETTTGPTLHALVGEGSLADPARANVVLLVTDGEESDSCNDGGSRDGPSGAAALLAQDPSVRTYVIGFSGDVDAGELNAVASAGGTGSFYPATDGDALASAFEMIATDVATCDFRLDEAPPDTDRLFVYFNDDPSGVPNDPANGWTYDASTMTLSFHGTACDEILASRVTDIDVVFGCMGPVLE